jgi:hydrogenase nickel incorporation protein HypA/HybF
VYRVRLAVGELAGVEPDLLRSAFEIARPGTICARAELEVVTHPMRWTCPACAREFARGEVLRCEACDRPARLDEKSEALVVETIEMEVP